MSARRLVAIRDTITNYDDSGIRETVILIVHQAIYTLQLEVNLLNLIKLSLSSVEVSEEAKFLAEKPEEYIHALKVSDEDESSRF